MSDNHQPELDQAAGTRTGRAQPRMELELTHAWKAPLIDLAQTLDRLSQRTGPLGEDERREILAALSTVRELTTRLPRAVAPTVSSVQLAESFPALLVMDPDPQTQRYLEQVLGGDFILVPAASELEAAGLLREHAPDAIITCSLDSAHGGMSMLETIRCDERTQNIPVLVLTDSADPLNRIRALQSGAFDYMSRPLPAAELVARIRNAVRSVRALRRERHLQEVDDLTGLANRRSLRSFMTTALRDHSHTGRPLSVAMIDQDNLKQINDVHGHGAGDAALKALADALSECKRATDCAARLGGDEFSVVMPGTGRDGALRFVTRVQEHLKTHPILLGGQPVAIETSFGVAETSPETAAGSWDELLQRADLLLYEQKRARQQTRGYRMAG